MPFYFIDAGFLYFALPALIFALFAQFKVRSTFNKYSQVRIHRGFTGEQAARAILDSEGLHDVRIEHIPGELSDHYDPRDNVIRLSDSVYNRASIAAVGVAAHEAGHALQYANHYFPIKVRTAILPVTQIGSTLAMPLILLSLIFPAFAALFDIGLILFTVVAIFQLITLPVEFNASNRAVKALAEGNYVDDEEHRGVKKVLSAAAMTYVAALATSIATILRLLMLRNRN